MKVKKKPMPMWQKIFYVIFILSIISTVAINFEIKKENKNQM